MTLTKIGLLHFPKLFFKQVGHVTTSCHWKVTKPRLKPTADPPGVVCTGEAWCNWRQLLTVKNTLDPKTSKQQHPFVGTCYVEGKWYTKDATNSWISKPSLASWWHVWCHSSLLFVPMNHTWSSFFGEPSSSCQLLRRKAVQFCWPDPNRAPLKLWHESKWTNQTSKIASTGSATVPASSPRPRTVKYSIFPWQPLKVHPTRPAFATTTFCTPTTAFSRCEGKAFKVPQTQSRPQPTTQPNCLHLCHEGCLPPVCPVQKKTGRNRRAVSKERFSGICQPVNPWRWHLQSGHWQDTFRDEVFLGHCSKDLRSQSSAWDATGCFVPFTSIYLTNPANFV